MRLLNSKIFSWGGLHLAHAGGFILARAREAGVLLALGVAGCQVPPPSPAVPSAVQPPVGAPIAPGGNDRRQHYQIDPQASHIRLLVYRAGPMARFGHNHVLSGPVQGELLAGDSAATSGFTLRIRADALTVDDPALRLEAGPEFAAPVSDAARAGTRENLLGAAVLDAQHHPLLHIQSIALSGPQGSPLVQARITLRGKESHVQFPAVVTELAGQLRVTASFELRQTELGITPFAVLGGAIAVADRLDVRMHLVAQAMP